jgi:xanthine dehydrogenase YagR molybdenum-binding subunit
MTTETMIDTMIGKPINRVDGYLKVTGAARYAAEFPFAQIAHAFVIKSTIAKGRITAIETTQADAAPGVLTVITHLNAPRLNAYAEKGNVKIKPGEKLVPMQSDQIHYDRQTIGLVVAETLEQARFAASLVQITYQQEIPTSSIEQGLSRAYQPTEFIGEALQTQKGDIEKGLATAEVCLEAAYVTPIEHHNSLESSAAIAIWQGDQLTIHDSTQWVIGSQQTTAETLGIPAENVRVLSPFLGGEFGCKGWPWWQPVLAAIAARKVGRPVKLSYTRQQMFSSCGHRPRTIQHLTLGAARDGHLTALRNITNSQTSEVDEHVEPCGLTTRLLYACPNVEIQHNLVQLNTSTPTAMRAPGECPSTFALESAMDELAYTLKIDPIELRLINHADTHPDSGKPWSSKHLKDCYRIGAERFGWSRRHPEPGLMRDGDFWVGYGMATATYPAYRSSASAKAKMFADGHVVLSSATHDIGTGTYTVMTQIAAEVLGLPLEHVEFQLGDSAMPVAPLAGGSQSAASVAPAVQGVATILRDRLIQLTIADAQSPLYGVAADQITTAAGRLFLLSEPSCGESYQDLLQRHNLPVIEMEATANTASSEAQQQARNQAVRICAGRDENADQQQYAFQSFGAQFVEVRVHSRLRRVQVSRVVSAMDCGRILNEKTAHSQIRGGVIMGIGMALMEETLLDPQTGRLLVQNLADYHVPVHADVHNIDVLFTDIPDPHISLIGVRGVGEIGITGVAAAIANAVYHATGKRIRELPITPDKLLNMILSE